MEGSGPEGMMSYRTEEEFLLVCGGQGALYGGLRGAVAGGLEQRGWGLGRVSKGLGPGEG